MFAMVARTRIFPLGHPEIFFWSNQESIVKGSYQFAAILRPVLPILSNPKNSIFFK